MRKLFLSITITLIVVALATIVPRPDVAQSRLQPDTCIAFGDFDPDSLISYTCSGADFSVDTWTFIDLGGGAIAVLGAPNFPMMLGTLDCSDSTFSVSYNQAGSCQMTYSLTGKFNATNSFDGVFSYTATTLQPPACANCVNQSYDVDATNSAVVATEENTWGRIKALYR